MICNFCCMMYSYLILLEANLMSSFNKNMYYGSMILKNKNIYENKTFRVNTCWLKWISV